MAHSKPNPKASYRIQPSGQLVEGQMVGAHLAIRKTEARHPKYVVDHVPTGYHMFSYDKLKTARTVAKQMSERYGDELSFTDPKEAANLSRLDPMLLAWARVADRYPTFEDFTKAHQRQQAEAKIFADEKREWEGKWVHWAVAGPRYGREAKILRVIRLVPSDAPEAIVADIQHSPTHTTLVASIPIDALVHGRAPKNMPWYELRRDQEWGARINRLVFRMAKIGDRYALWTVGPGGIPEAEPPIFDSRHEGEQAAKAFAAGARARNPALSIKERLLAY